MTRPPPLACMNRLVSVHVTIAPPVCFHQEIALFPVAHFGFRTLMAPCYTSSYSTVTGMSSVSAFLSQTRNCNSGCNIARSGCGGEIKSPRNLVVCLRHWKNEDLVEGFIGVTLQDGKNFAWRVGAGNDGVWFRRKRRWKVAASSASVIVSEISGVGTEADVLEGLGVKVKVSVPSGTSASAVPGAASSTVLFRSDLNGATSSSKWDEDKHYDRLLEIDTNKSCAVESTSTQVAVKYLGVQLVRGRFEVELQKDDVVHKLIFSSQEEAAKAYDKAEYKINGSLAQTNFDLGEEEKLEIQGIEWEDLLLKMQLEALSKNSPVGLGYPGVQFKEDEQLWQVKIRRDKDVYVGYFATMKDATLAYDLSAYKLHGADAVLSKPITLSEKAELLSMDWDSLVTRLGLKLQARRIRRKFGCRGVRLTASGTWHSSFTHKSFFYYLGTFKTKEIATKAYDLFATKLIGEQAKVNSQLLPEEKEFLSTQSVSSLREFLAGQAVEAPKQIDLGARGARLVQGQWEVCLHNARKDRIFTSSVSSEQEALKVHDIVAYKLHNKLAKTYQELSKLERQEVESADWNSVAAKLELHQLPSYHGVNRLISGVWQSYLRHGGAYLAVGTFDSAEKAARASDMCAYKLGGQNAILNFPLSEFQRREIEATDWAQLTLNLREGQIKPDVDTGLGDPQTLTSQDVPRDKKWTHLLCHEQLLQQRMLRRAPKVGRQLVVGNPSIAAQFSHLNRRADGSPMLVEEVMDGSNTPLLWYCTCGNVFLKAPVGLRKAKHAACRMPGCSGTRTTRRKYTEDENFDKFSHVSLRYCDRKGSL